MGQADNPAGAAGQSRRSALLPASADLVIIGGGIMGLWAAVKAQRRGIRTVLLDADEPGEGASGGVLGALMPHMPDKWNEKKQFQFEALVSLEDEISRLEAETGLSCGYRRSGRIIPLPKPHLRTIALRHSQEAQTNWQQLGRHFHWHVMDESPYSGWPEAMSGDCGFVHDTFAAKVSPRRLMAALKASLHAGSHVTVVPQSEVQRIDAAASRVVLADGEGIGFGRCIVAAGHRAFPLLEAISAPLTQPLGQPVKGQAALMRADIDPDRPLLFLNGLYVVPHEGGHVAIGSTSEEAFGAPLSTDAQLDDLIGRARLLVPELRYAEVVERWAGLRPKAIDRDPMVGPHPDHPHVIALTGGFKVSFGLAHRLADAVIGEFFPANSVVPLSFHLENHLSVAAR